jgi:hypothetical protein
MQNCGVSKLRVDECHSIFVVQDDKTLLIGIETAPSHFDERAAIRETWMKYVSVEGKLSGFERAQ